MPKLGPLKYSEEPVGAEVTIHRGLGGKSDIMLPGCSVNNFTLDAQEGNRHEHFADSNRWEPK
jgi:hypothetical protein